MPAPMLLWLSAFCPTLETRFKLIPTLPITVPSKITHLPHAQTGMSANDLVTKTNIHKDQASELSKPVSALLQGLVGRNDKQVKEYAIMQ